VHRSSSSSWALLSWPNPPEYVISTFAGGAPPPTPILGVDMPFGTVQSVAADAMGNTYFVASHCVFKLNQNGVVTRIAGNGRDGYSGDGGPATSAQLRLESLKFATWDNWVGQGVIPPGVTVDNGGKVYVADNGNYRIRRISPDRIIYGATQGETDAEAMEMAQDLLMLTVSDYIREGKQLPVAARPRGAKFRQVPLPALQSAKVDLYTAFLKSGLKKAEFARRMGIPKTHVERLFSLRHPSRLDQIEAALAALGKCLHVEVCDAA
jgi:antitoxin HicB